jgi:hypothetical protein
MTPPLNEGEVRRHLDLVISQIEVLAGAYVPVSPYVRHILNDARQGKWKADPVRAIELVEYYLGRAVKAVELERAERNGTTWAAWIEAGRPQLPKP